MMNHVLLLLSVFSVSSALAGPDTVSQIVTKSHREEKNIFQTMVLLLFFGLPRGKLVTNYIEKIYLKYSFLELFLQ